MDWQLWKHCSFSLQIKKNYIKSYTKTVSLLEKVMFQSTFFHIVQVQRDKKSENVKT